MSRTSPSEGKLVGFLRNRYPASEYIVLEQVRSGNTIHDRTADALAIGLWKSRDMSISGFELKANRAGWLKELEHPAKAEQIAQYCDHWWLVASDETIVKPKELPKPWGLYIPDGKSLKVVVEAPKLTPVPLDKMFLSCLMRSLIDKNPAELNQEQLKAAHAEGYLLGLSEGESRATTGKDKIIEWLNGELHRKNMKLEALEQEFKLDLLLDDEELRIWGEIIKDVTKLHPDLRRNKSSLHAIITALYSISTASFENMAKQYMRLNTHADALSKIISEKVQAIQLLQEDTKHLED